MIMIENLNMTSKLQPGESLNWRHLILLSVIYIFYLLCNCTSYFFSLDGLYYFLYFNSSCHAFAGSDFQFAQSCKSIFYLLLQETSALHLLVVFAVYIPVLISQDIKGLVYLLPRKASMFMSHR